MKSQAARGTGLTAPSAWVVGPYRGHSKAGPLPRCLAPGSGLQHSNNTPETARAP